MWGYLDIWIFGYLDILDIWIFGYLDILIDILCTTPIYSFIVQTNQAKPSICLCAGSCAPRD